MPHRYLWEKEKKPTPDRLIIFLELIDRRNNAEGSRRSEKGPDRQGSNCGPPPGRFLGLEVKAWHCLLFSFPTFLLNNHLLESFKTGIRQMRTF